MKFVLFYHSLVSDWNHGNAHFLRGVASELQSRGHAVAVYEPENSWSRQNLLQEHGAEPIERFRAAYPGLESVTYRWPGLDLERVTRGADAVLVHEWNDPSLVNALGALRAKGARFRLYFHDTHHRMETNPGQMEQFNLHPYDGVLAYGQVLRSLYAKSGRVRQAWTWHEAADARVFQPLPTNRSAGELVWIGNWGDDERSEELHEFLIGPVKALGLGARVYGVRYSPEARAALRDAGIEYAGWLPNFDVPRVFSEYQVTVHIPRRPYVKALPGIPTIRVFEALACGIPMVCSPWEDAEGLFEPGVDFLEARSGKQMRRCLELILSDPKRAARLAAQGTATIRARHTCAHRVDELLQIIDQTHLD